MKKRIAYISLYFFTVLLIFILQKPLFMLYNGSIEKGFGFADYMQVMIHGASLDAATAGYLTAFPFLLVLISIWFRKFPLKKNTLRVLYFGCRAYFYHFCGRYGIIHILGI